MRTVLVVLLACFLLVFALSGAMATQIVHMSPQKMGQNASEVVRGSVASVHSYWNATRTKIFTETVVTVDESYKGSATGQVTLLQLGGEVDGVRVTVHGALHWTAGEEVLLFLEPYAEGKFHVAGFSQGKYEVERDPVTGRAFVKAPELEDVKLVGGDGTGNTAAPKRVPLDRFVADALGAQYRPSDR